MPFRFIDLFAGIGGLRQGFTDIGGKCVFTSEWDRFCKKTYEENYGKEQDFAGDLRQIQAKDVPSHDVLLAGFPCQPFSIAGVSKKKSLNQPHGFRCTAQGTLFFDVARIIEDCRPSVFILENVKNLVNHDKGRTFKHIKKILQEEIGYHTHFKIIDARCFLPQRRERVFMVGFREKVPFTFDDMEIPDPAYGPRLQTILHPEDGSEKADPRYIEGKQGRVLPKYTLSAHLWEYLQDYARRQRLKGNGFGYGLFGPQSVARTLSSRYYKDGSEILIQQQDGRRPRRLTPRECARLLGFEELGGERFRIPVSDVQAYRQFGNAVAVPVAVAVARHMKKWIV